MAYKALWSTMSLYNINANLIQVIENLYNKATSPVYLNGDTGDRFRTRVGVSQVKGVYSHQLFSTSFWREL